MNIEQNRTVFIENRLEVYEFESMFSYVVYHQADYTVVTRIALNLHYEPHPACEDHSVVRHFYGHARSQWSLPRQDSDLLDWQEWIKRDEQEQREWMEGKLSETVDEFISSSTFSAS